MLRQAWLRGLAVGLGLTTGCLYHTTTGATEEIRPPQTIVPPSVVVADNKGAPENVRPALSLEAPAKVSAKIEMGPAPPSPVLPPPPRLDKPVELALRRMLEKHPDKAARELERLDASRRERLLALLKLTVGVSEGDIEKLPPEEAAGLLEHLRHVCKELCRRAPLELRNVAYCRSVKGFGQYEPAGEKPRFQAGAEGQPGERVQVYAEVCHFRSQANQGGHETRLDASLEVLNGKGERVAKIPLGTCSDCSQSPRHDYFLNCQFHVPAGLKPGKYTLRLKVRDLAPGGGARQARSSLELRVTAPRAS